MQIDLPRADKIVKWLAVKVSQEGTGTSTHDFIWPNIATSRESEHHLVKSVNGSLSEGSTLALIDVTCGLEKVIDPRDAINDVYMFDHQTVWCDGAMVPHLG